MWKARVWHVLCNSDARHQQRGKWKTEYAGERDDPKLDGIPCLTNSYTLSQRSEGGEVDRRRAAQVPRSPLALQVSKDNCSGTLTAKHRSEKARIHSAPSPPTALRISARSSLSFRASCGLTARTRVTAHASCWPRRRGITTSTGAHCGQAAVAPLGVSSGKALSAALGASQHSCVRRKPLHRP